MAATRFSIDAIFKAHDKFSGPVARMTTRMGKFARNVKKGMGGIGRMAKRVTHGMKAMAFSMATLGVIGGFALKGLIAPAARFEQAMAGIDAVTLGSIENIGALSEKAQLLGRTTIFTATEVARAMEIMGRAGLSGGEISGGIDSILNAAAAESASIEDSAKIIISTMKGFDLPFDKTTTGRVADVFATISASAKTNIIALGEGLSKVAPVAHQFGLNWEEMTVAVAALQDVGIEASMSGTQLKTMLNKLANLTPKAAKKFKQLGIEIGDSNGNMKQMPELLEEIVQGLHNTKGNMEKVAAISEAVGLRGAVAANILAASWGKSEKGIKDLMAALLDADGNAAEMNRRRQDNLLGDITKLKSAWEGFRIDMVSGSLPELRKVVQDLTQWLLDPANIESAAEKFENAILGLKAFWNQNGSTMLAMADTAYKTAVVTWEIMKMLYQVGDWLKPDDIIKRTLGSDVDAETAQRHMRYEATGELPPEASATNTVKHKGKVYDVDALSGILHVTTDPGLKAEVVKQFDTGQSGFAFEANGGF